MSGPCRARVYRPINPAREAPALTPGEREEKRMHDMVRTANVIVWSMLIAITPPFIMVWAVTR